MSEFSAFDKRFMIMQKYKIIEYKIKNILKKYVNYFV